MNSSTLNKEQTQGRGLLYTKMKIFHFKEKIDSLPKENKKILAPIHIRIKPTNVCNHNCRYCAYRVDNLQLGQDMSKRDFIPKEKMKEIIEDLKNIGVRAVTFSGGGDPFCYPYLLDTLKLLIDKKIKFSALTNGSKLEGELAELFSRYGTWLRISLDGWNDKSYALYRRVPKGEFKKVIDNMGNFKNLYGKCYLGVSLVVDRENATHIYELAKILKNIGVDSLKISPCVVDNDGVKNDQYHQPIFSIVKSQIEKSVADLATKRFEIFDAYHASAEDFDKKYSWCAYLQIRPVIGADLNVYSCQDKAYNLDGGLIGSIKNKRFKDFWFSDKGKFFKINPSIHCKNHCVVNAHNKLIFEYLNADRGHLEFA